MREEISEGPHTIRRMKMLFRFPEQSPTITGSAIHLYGSGGGCLLGCFGLNGGTVSPVLAMPCSARCVVAAVAASGYPAVPVVHLSGVGIEGWGKGWRHWHWHWHWH